MSRGAGVLLKLRVEQRVGLSELVKLLWLSGLGPDDEPTVADIRKAVATQLAQSGSEGIIDAADQITEARDHGEDVDEALGWARQMIAKAYRRDFARFPAELAAFEAGEAR
ncbi:hypothetical protein ACFQ7O_23945 [Streptomyces sp. NPDC056485]|uniref:hypothetical protein n=1 Tax=Streptomyces sp. NPDC056485 TaxID=3345834 RepID=UPI0036C9280C